MRKLSISELNRLNKEEYRQAEKNDVIIILDNVRSANNVGAVFRTCDAFRIKALFLCGITARPPHKEIQKTAIGASETVDWKYFKTTLEAVKQAKQQDYACFAVEQCEGSVWLQQQNFTQKKTALVFGNEVTGVGQEVIDVCNGCLEIPQYGTKHSLNIAVSAGIVIWEVVSRAYLPKK